MADNPKGKLLSADAPTFVWMKSRHGKAGTPALYLEGVPASHNAEVASAHPYKPGLSLEEHATLYAAAQPPKYTWKD